jgi:hypothetical protein
LQDEATGENDESGRGNPGLIVSGWKASKAEGAGGVSVSGAGSIVGGQPEGNSSPGNVSPTGISDGSAHLGESVERATIVFHLEV